jgi:hypothetical protein
VYWIVIIIGFMTLRFKETRGHWPGMKAKTRTAESDPEGQRSPSLPDSTDGALTKEAEAEQGGKVYVREVK